jgi:Transposase DDE domain group 1
LPESRLRPHFVKAVVRVHEYPDGTASVFLGPHRLATFGGDGQQLSPDAPQPGRVLGALKDKPLAGRVKCASLTAPARAAVTVVRVRAKERASSRTKELTKRKNNKTKEDAVASAVAWHDRRDRPRLPVLPIYKPRRRQITSYQNTTSSRATDSRRQSTDANLRFIVINLDHGSCDARFLCEHIDCYRGEMEDRIKGSQSALFADRAPTPTMRANQLLLRFTSLTYILMCAVRGSRFAGAQFERATCGTIRQQLHKIGTLVAISVPASSWPSLPHAVCGRCSRQRAADCAFERGSIRTSQPTRQKRSNIGKTAKAGRPAEPAFLTITLRQAACYLP